MSKVPSEFDPRHTTRSPPFGKRIWIRGIKNKFVSGSDRYASTVTSQLIYQAKDISAILDSIDSGELQNRFKEPKNNLRKRKSKKILKFGQRQLKFKPQSPRYRQNILWKHFSHRKVSHLAKKLFTIPFFNYNNQEINLSIAWSFLVTTHVLKYENAN